MILSRPPINRTGGVRRTSIRRQWSALALGGFLFTSVFALVAPSVEAQCPKGWDISGQWGLKQSNQAEPNSIWLDVSSFSGTASYPGMTGSVSGRVVGNKVHLEISWANGRTGIYDGTIGPRGKLEGTGYEKRSPGVKVTWYSDRAMRCPPVQFQRGQFVIVKCLNSLFGGSWPANSPIHQDVSIGKKYEVAEPSGSMVTIRTPGGKKETYSVRASCVELAPR